MELNFSHIKGRSWKKFEQIVFEYFKEVKKDKKRFPTIQLIRRRKSGIGPDGSKDLLISFIITDSIVEEHTLTWVIQCKCYKSTVSPKQINSVNIPTLIHRYKAVGYLLICKGNVTDGISEMFAGLNDNCRLGYKYEYWEGDDFAGKIMDLGWNSNFVKKRFRKYYNYEKLQDAKINAIKKRIKKRIKKK